MTEHSLFLASKVNLLFQTFKNRLFTYFELSFLMSFQYLPCMVMSTENLSWLIYGGALIEFNILYRYIIPPPFRFYQEGMQLTHDSNLLIWPTISLRIYRLYHRELLKSDSYIWSISYEVNFMHSNKYNVCDINSQRLKASHGDCIEPKNSLHF